MNILNWIRNRLSSIDELRRTQATRESEGKPTSEIRREINTRRSTDEIRQMIADREAVGKPTRELREELGNRET